ncbi:MAG TPA: glycosyltransferase, partial [Kineobactrum sp.]
ATLNACYQRADALVCASWAEGFGLPIVEGLRHGAPVVASDIDAFREVGGDACRYFSPDRPEQLVAALEPLLLQWQQGTPMRQETCDLAVNWHESAVQFRDEVLRLAAARPQQ